MILEPHVQTYLNGLLGCDHEWRSDSEWDGVERNYFNVCIKCNRVETDPRCWKTLDFNTWHAMGVLRGWLDRKQQDDVMRDFFPWLEKEIKSMQVGNAVYWWWIMLDHSTLAYMIYKFFRIDSRSTPIIPSVSLGR